MRTKVDFNENNCTHNGNYDYKAFICDMCEVKQCWWDSQKLTVNLFVLSAIYRKLAPNLV